MIARALPVLEPTAAPCGAPLERIDPAAPPTVRTLPVLESRAAKLVGDTGRPVAAVYRSRDTCPTTCKLRPIGPAESRRYGVPERAGSCYAYNRGQGGRPSPFDSADRGADDSALPAEWSRPAGTRGALRPGSILRLCVSGDLLRPQVTPDGTYRMVPDDRFIDSVNRIANDRGDVRAAGILAYTHGWRVLERAMFHGWAPQASCDTIAETVQARAAGWAPVLTVPESDPAGTIGSTIVGAGRVIQCLEQSRGTACAACMLCARPDRPSVIAFTAHGTNRRRITAEPIA